MHSCPSCQATLQTPPLDLKADAICDRCGGVWISASTLKSALQAWRIQSKFVESGPSSDFCPSCGPVPLDEGSLLGQDGLRCSSCRGVFMRKALRYERQQVSINRPAPKAPAPKAPAPKAPVPKAPAPKAPVPKAPAPKAPAPKASQQKNIKKKKSKTPKDKAKSELDFNKNDAIWITVLLVAIMISLIYWMNP